MSLKVAFISLVTCLMRTFNPLLNFILMPEPVSDLKYFSFHSLCLIIPPTLGTTILLIYLVMVPWKSGENLASYDTAPTGSFSFWRGQAWLLVMIRLYCLHRLQPAPGSSDLPQSASTPAVSVLAPRSTSPRAPPGLALFHQVSRTKGHGAAASSSVAAPGSFTDGAGTEEWWDLYIVI